MSFSTYQACDSLFMLSGTGERFGYRQMARVDSPLTREGREICKAMADRMGRPWYYYLHRYYSRQAEACPGCGGPSGPFDYRYDPWRKRSLAFDVSQPACCLRLPPNLPRHRFPAPARGLPPETAASCLGKAAASRTHSKLGRRDNQIALGGPWRLEERLHRLYDYKCDRCRLLSTEPA